MLLLLVVIGIAIAGMYVFRMNPYVKALGNTLLGDRTLKNVMMQYKVKFIPWQLIHYRSSGPTSDSISVSWAFRPEYSVAFYPVPVVDDSDHDGKPEVYISSYSRYIYSLDGTSGSTLWKWKLPFGVTGGKVVNLVDLNNDGKRELILGTHTTLPIRVYALKTGKRDNDRLLWKTNLNGDFLEGGLTVVENKSPLIIAATRDAPYSRGSLNILKADGSFLLPSISGLDNCVGRPAVGILPGSKKISLIHGSHNFYKATFANKIVARDISTGKVLWMSSNIGDTGFQNHQLIDIDFDGKNEVLAIALNRKEKKEHRYILNGYNGAIVKEVLWEVQGILKKTKQLIVSQAGNTMCLSKSGDIIYSIPKISFGIQQSDDQIFLFGISYLNKTLVIKKYDAFSGELIKTYSCNVAVPDHKNPGDYGVMGAPSNIVSFLTLADTDNNGSWDCLLQIKDFVVNIKLPVKVAASTSGFAPLPFRNLNNGGVIY